MSLLSKKKSGAVEPSPALAVALSAQKVARKSKSFASYQAEIPETEERPSSLAEAIRAKYRKPKEEDLLAESEEWESGERGMASRAATPEEEEAVNEALFNDSNDSEIPSEPETAGSIAERIRIKMRGSK